MGERDGADMPISSPNLPRTPSVLTPRTWPSRSDSADTSSGRGKEQKEVPVLG